MLMICLLVAATCAGGLAEESLSAPAKESMRFTVRNPHLSVSVAPATVSMLLTARDASSRCLHDRTRINGLHDGTRILNGDRTEGAGSAPLRVAMLGSARRSFPSTIPNSSLGWGGESSTPREADLAVSVESASSAFASFGPPREVGRQHGQTCRFDAIAVPIPRSVVGDATRSPDRPLPPPDTPTPYSARSLANGRPLTGIRGPPHMLDLFTRLLASVAGVVAVVFGLQAAPPAPSTLLAPPTPLDGIEALAVAPGLAATLVAEAPTITNPTNIDVDARGRIWPVEGFNYRKFKPKPLRAEGDRVVILEDTTGDGVSDKTTVFYQGTDIDAAMGIAVFGNKVYVSAYTKIFVFTDTNGDDKPDKKEVLFTASGPADHDHSTHAFVFGPDGRLYFNGGNETRSIMDSAGNVLVDRAGYRVETKREPYQEGMAFRLEPDATKFEVLGYNFRNPYELAVDSYGTVWQTDNDDDGNRATRLNYVMEGGNYGYRDEMTGAFWRTRRTNMEPEIPRQHWHLADPGVVPNVRINGAGSPSGVAFYEGTLLPKQYHGTVLHADPGPNELRAFTLSADGAGYSAERLPIIESPKDKMFRPVDVAVAPDGSLIVADWYDAGVGGHNMSDQSQGRIIRIAPPGTRYTVPKLELSSPAGAARALRSPNLATRQLAYERLARYGARAEAPLAAMWRGTVPHDRARALWLLARIPGRGARYLAQASRDADPNIRITALRATRRIDGDVIEMAERLVRDSSPAVRREVAIALRHNQSPRAAALWAGLAQQYDGRDRWYLEALGVAADKQWDVYFGKWLDRIDDWNTPAGRDIVWRARSARALPPLEKLASDQATPVADRLRYFRAIDFHPAESRQKSLLALLATPAGASAELTPVILTQLDPKTAGTIPEVQ